jgi:hypothetical protein
MAFSLSWVGVKGKTAETVRNELGLHAMGGREELPDSDITGVSMPGGWYLIVANRFGHKLLHERNLKTVSASAELVTCEVEEHVMVSIATGWKNGQRIWSVGHDAQKEQEHLVDWGELPAIYADIKNQLEADQQAAGGEKADVDYIFDIPVELAEKLTGFRHDKQMPELGEYPFEVLIKKSGLENDWSP